MIFSAYAILPPLSPLDKPHRASIYADTAPSTMARTPREAWLRQIRYADLTDKSPGEIARRIQHWHDRGYRLAEFEVRMVEGDDT